VELLVSPNILSNRPEVEAGVDVLRDIFSAMHVKAVVPTRLEATAPWGLAHSVSEADRSARRSNVLDASFKELAQFGMVSRGNCWLTVEGVNEPLALTGGDCFLIAPGRNFTLRDDPRTPAKDFCAATQAESGGVLHYGGGGALTTIIWGLLCFEKPSLKPVTQLLPNLILIKADHPQTLALHTAFQLLAAETSQPAPGSELLANRLAEVVFIQVLRAHIASTSGTCERSWLRAIFDPQIGSALKAIHKDVNGAWTVESLAETAGMSRSAFALRFKELLGQTPLDYVTEWRMQKAIELLQRDKKLIEVAQCVGYESDAAFSKAFKRVVGVSPGEYRNEALSGKALGTAAAAD
jgi:AraC-like DNA-binding protein